MTEPLNPYESPVIPHETQEAAVEPKGVIANFVIDAAQQWLSARLVPAPVPNWVNWVAPLLVIAFGVATISLGFQFGELLAVGFALLCMVSFAVVQYYRNRQYALGMLELLRAHPVLGVTGNWKLTVDREEIRVETSGGQQNFRRDVTPVQLADNDHLTIWFEGYLPIIVPEHGAYAKMCRNLRLWLIKTRPL